MMTAELNEEIRKERKKLKREKTRAGVISAVSVLTALIVWELIVRLKLVDVRYVAMPTQVISMFIHKLFSKTPDGSTLFQHIASSMQLSLTGFGLAVVIGTPLGLLMGWYKPVDKFVKPVFNLVRPIPAVSWIPVMIAVLGIGIAAKSFIIFLSAFVAIVLNSYAGIKLTNRAMINVARTSGASYWRIFLNVGVPSAMPMVFTGWRVALGISWSTLVAAEMLAANSGLGYMILFGRQFLKIDLIMCGMVVIGLIGVILFALLNKLERVVLRWRQ